MADQEDIDHEHTDEIVCPYCGHEQSDSWEWGTPGDEMDCAHDECGACGATFVWSRRISESYSTQKLEDYEIELQQRRDQIAQYRLERKAKR